MSGLRSLMGPVRHGRPSKQTFGGVHPHPSYVRNLNTSPLHGKRCMITGGTSELGLGISKTFIDAGASTIALVGRNKTRLVERIETLKSRITVEEKHSFIPIVADVSKEIPDIEKHGDFDILVNAAGLTHQSILLSTEEQVIRNVLDTNLLGTILMCKAFVKHVTRSRLRRQRQSRKQEGLEENGGGAPNLSLPCIINISSLLGQKGGRGSSIYAASKAGIIAFSRALSLECASKASGIDATIRINTIVPGYLESGMTEAFTNSGKEQISQAIPLRRFGLSEEIAEGVLFLATNPYAHNAVLNLDGGLSAT